MKKVIFIAISTLILMSCKNNKKQVVLYFNEFGKITNTPIITNEVYTHEYNVFGNDTIECDIIKFQNTTELKHYINSNKNQ